MLRWPNNQGVMGDDPPYLVVGTEVSAKYKGAFCEAKVRKVVRTVKCKVNFKLGLGTAVVTDDQIRGTLRVGSVVEVKHPDRKEYVEAHIAKIQDCSQYTVVFDDGDITTLRRTALCLKSGRHFAESETLDQLPLTHPEHFGNPVVGNRRGGRRSRNPMSDESSDEEEEPRKGKPKEEKEADIGKVVCVELGDKKKQKDNWFPGLVVAPTAQEVVRIRVKDEYLVRSFKDGRYFTVPKKEAMDFTREIGSKVDNNTLKTAVDKAVQFMDKDELPPHWDRELLFGLDDASTASDSDAAFESDSSDDEPREEKDHFVAQLYKFMDDRGTPINRGPAISGRDIDLYKLFKVVHKLGGHNRVTNHNQWKMVSHKLGFGQFSNTGNLVKAAYKKYLHSFEDFYRKLGCTMVNHPRGNRSRHRGGRSLIRDKDRATPVNVPRGEGKDKGSDMIDDDEDTPEKGEESAECSMDDKEEELSKRKEGKSKEKEDIFTDTKKTNEKSIVHGYEKDDRPQRLGRDVKKDERLPRKDDKSSSLLTVTDSGVVTKLLIGPPPLERKLSDPLLKISTPKGKPKRVIDGSGNRSGLEAKKKIVVTKLKGTKPVEDGDDEMEELDVEDVEEEDDDKLTTTRSKAKEEFSKLKVDSRSSLESEKKSRVIEGGERKTKPLLSATAEKRPGRPSLSAISDKKAKPSQDNDRKTVRSLAAEFEKKARGLDAERKESSSSDADKKPRSYSVGDSDKKIRPSLSATLERKRPVVDSDKKSRQAGTESEKKVRPSLTADIERKKVRPSLTADPTKKVSRLDSEKKRENDRKSLRPSDAEKDEGDRKSKMLDAERKVNTPDSGKLPSMGDSDRRSSKSDSGDSEKRGTSKSRKGDDDKRKFQVRKRKDNDENGGSSVDESLDQLASYKNVSVGDKLKVYYGPTHESKVTYEAKVLEVEGDSQDEAYLVHYTGWNNRYDEWIKRSRIADNLSWSPARAKRRHQTQSMGVKKPSIKRRTLTPARDGASPSNRDQAVLSLPGGDKSQPPRSSTPSSVTSSSSRTKSPAMRPSSARVTRNTIGEVAQQLVEQSMRRTRTRRVSGQTDLPSESESEASGSESEAEPFTTRKSSRRLASEKEDDSSRKDVAPKKKLRIRDEIDMDEEDEKEGEKGDIKDDSKDDDDASSESPSEDKLPMKRTRKGTRSVMDRKAEVKAEVEEDEAPSHSTKGKDFDLNQLRSELKGIDKTVKASSPSGSDKEQKTNSDGDLDLDVDVADPPDRRACTLLESEESAIDMEDIYEFKEPEPFEFEVRSKREPSVERIGKLQKRPLPRIFDDVEPIIKKKVVKSSGGDSESSEEGSPSKKKFRRSVGKKDEVEVKIESQSPPPELVIEKTSASEQLTPQKKTYSSSTDDAFEKLRQSPSYRFSAGSPMRAPTLTLSRTSPVPVPMQSPPQSSTSIPGVITCAPILPLNRPPMSVASNTVSQSSASKAVPPLITKPASTIQSLKPTQLPVSAPSPSQGPTPSLSIGTVTVPAFAPALVLPTKLTSNQETLVTAKPVQPSSAALLSSRPPLLAAAVKISSETGIISKSDEWLKTRQAVSEKYDSNKEEQIIKTEKDDSLPPLVPTAFSVPVAGRTSPEPPQLLPMFGTAPKVLNEPTKTEETKDIPMPQIKKESLTDLDLIIPQVGQSVGINSSPKAPALEEHNEDLPEEDLSRKTGRRKAQMKRKKAVSKEFVEDSDSDSSDEGRRLVIDKSESSDSCNELSEAKSAYQAKDHEAKWRTTTKQPDSCSEPQKSNLTSKDDFNSSKLKEPFPLSIDSSTEDTLSAGKAEDPEEPEADSNLCSLLCEETIPGSPAPPSDASADAHSEVNTARTSERLTDNSKTSCKVLEMPFASVPGNTRSSGPSTTNTTAAQCSKSATQGEKAETAGSDLVVPKAGPSSVSNEAAPVMDNTPPTTPDSSISTISNSPRGDHGDSMSILDNESTKSHRDSEDADAKDNDFSDDDLDVGSRTKRLSALSDKKDNDREKGRCDTDLTTISPSKKRRRSRKGSESEDRSKRARHSTSRLPGRSAASDSDDNTESSATVMALSQSQSQATCHPPAPILSNMNMQSQASRSPRPSKYNFFVELAPELDASQRIALLQQTLQELRKTYANVKQQLACIDRRRKKLRRREREARLEARKMMREERKQAREELVSCS